MTSDSVTVLSCAIRACILDVTRVYIVTTLPARLKKSYKMYGSVHAQENGSLAPDKDDGKGVSLFILFN